jgi:hypothetical protein
VSSDDGIGRLRRIFESTGLKGLAATLSDYVRWRMAGSPPDPHLPIEVRLERVDAAMVVVIMRDHYSTRRPTLSPLISVILPTKDRPERLRRAVGSVLAQSYENWELWVVNDSPSTVNPPSPDERVMVVQNDGTGVSAARNSGLARARGEVITYLDDDNLMDPHWLNAIALTIEETPQAEVLIGAQLVTPDPGSPEHHIIRFPPRFDWEELTRANYVDMGMLAHRPNDVSFDDDLSAMVDWDFVVRLTHVRSPVLVPAVSGIYMTGSPGRVSYQDRHRLLKMMHQRFAAMTPPVSATAAAIIGRHDLEALQSMLGRVASQRGRVPRLLVATPGKLTESVAGSMGSGVMTPGHGETADVILIQGLPSRDALGRLDDAGFVIGLASGEVDYGMLGLSHSRPVGDHLWVGSKSPFDPESLFDGATLVKFGTIDDR